jgi:membrane protein implicated in regulation of membrane protease activity
MIAVILILVALLAILYSAIFLLWLVSYLFDGVTLIAWLEQGAWKLPVFGSLSVFVVVITYAFQSDSAWESLVRRCKDLPKLRNQNESFVGFKGTVETKGIFYTATVIATDQGLVLMRRWKKVLFLPWTDVLEVRVDWSNHKGQRAEVHLPNYDAPSYVFQIPWSPEMAKSSKGCVEIWNRGNPMEAI